MGSDSAVTAWRRLCVAAVVGTAACSFEGAAPATDPGDEPDANAENDAAVAQCVPQPSGIVAWWDGEVIGEDTIGGASATGLRGSPTAEEGLVGLATRFGVDDLFEVSSAPAPVLFTLEGWIRLEQTDPEGWVGIYGRFAQASASIYENRLTFWEGDAGGVEGNLALGTLVQPNTWHHFAITWDGITASTYLDGDLGAQQQAPVVVELPSDVTVGGLVNGQDELRDPFAGLIDELTLYSRSLGASEIASIAAAGAAGKCK